MYAGRWITPDRVDDVAAKLEQELNGVALDHEEREEEGANSFGRNDRGGSLRKRSVFEALCARGQALGPSWYVASLYVGAAAVKSTLFKR